MSQVTAENLLKRHQRAMERKDQWRSLLDQAYFYALPNRNPWDMVLEGTAMDTGLYDMTLASDTTKFVNQTISSLTPPEIDWLSFIPGSSVNENTMAAIAEKLQIDTEIFFYYIRKSNFDVAIQEAYEDMAVSTGIIQVNEGTEDDPLIFSTVPNDKVGLETDPHGDLSAFYRDYKEMPLEHVRDLWGDDIKIPEAVFNGQPPHTLNIKECSYYDFKEKVYYYYLVSPDYKEIMLSDTFESWPWIGFRWSRRSGEDRGRGPALMAAPTAATINKAIEDELRSAALNANPPYMAFHDYVINPYNFKVEPNTIIPVNPLGTETWPIAPLPVGANTSYTAIVINDLRAQIHDIMFTQSLQPLQQEKIRTATEVAIKQGELRDNRGAAYSRVQRELLLPLVKRVVFILSKKKIMDPLIIDGKQVDVSFKTPLTLNKDVAEVKTFLEYFEVLSALYTPGIAINLLKVEKIPRWAGRKLGANLEMIKGEQEIVKLVQQAAQAALGAVESQQPGAQEVPPQAFGLTE